MAELAEPGPAVPGVESPGQALLIVDPGTAADSGRRRQLEEDGYEVRVEKNRVPFILDPPWTPDLVFVDLPKATALELSGLLRCVRAAIGYGEVPIVVCSHFSPAVLRQAGFTFSPIDFAVANRRLSL